MVPHHPDPYRPKQTLLLPNSNHKERDKVVQCLSFGRELDKWRQLVVARVWKISYCQKLACGEQALNVFKGLWCNKTMPACGFAHCLLHRQRVALHNSGRQSICCR